MKKHIGIITIGVGCVLGLISVIGAFLFGFDVLKFGVNAISVAFLIFVLFFGILFISLCFLYHNRKIELQKQELQRAIEQDKQARLLALYKSFGIPPQRDKNGELLNFYELLGIEPKFDENGERIPTVYEILNIVPRFNENGIEVPSVVFIKNKAQKLAVTSKLPQALSKMQSKESFEIESKKKVEEKPDAKKVAPVKKAAASKGKSSGGSSKKGSRKFEGMITNAIKVSQGTIGGAFSIRDLFNIGTQAKSNVLSNDAASALNNNEIKNKEPSPKNQIEIPIIENIVVQKVETPKVSIIQTEPPKENIENRALDLLGEGDDETFSLSLGLSIENERLGASVENPLNLNSPAKNELGTNKENNSVPIEEIREK